MPTRVMSVVLPGRGTVDFMEGKRGSGELAAAHHAGFAVHAPETFRVEIMAAFFQLIDEVSMRS